VYRGTWECEVTSGDRIYCVRHGLDKAVAQGKTPIWVNEIGPEYLQIIKDLGNTAAHTNSGDLSKQEALARDLIGAWN